MFANITRTHLPSQSQLHRPDMTSQLFYYLFNNKTGNRSSNCFLALLKGLVQQEYAVRQTSQEFITVLKATMASRIHQHATEAELSKIFFQGLQIGDSQVYVMIDALDEAEDPLKVIRWLKDLTRTKATTGVIKSLITSRCQPDLQSQLWDVMNQPMDPGLIDRDIGLCIPTCVRDVISKHGITDPHKIVLIQRALSKDTNGLFLWIRMLTEYLTFLPSVGEVMTSLDHFPENLTQLYMQILNQLATRLSVHSARRKTASKVIKWLCFARSNLSLAALGEALATEPGDTSFSCDKIPGQLDILLRELLGSFIEIVAGAEGPTIQFVHLSVKDFFLHDEVRTQISGVLLPYFPVAKQAHATIAGTLLQYLKFPSRSEIKIDGITLDTHDALLPYAVFHCLSHFRDSGEQGRDLLPLVQALIMSQEGLVWLEAATGSALMENEGDLLVVFQSHLTSWNQDFAGTAETSWLEEAVSHILHSSRSTTDQDSLQFVERTYQLASFLVASGKINEATKFARECQLMLQEASNLDHDRSRLLEWRITFMLGMLSGLRGRPIEALALCEEQMRRDPGGTTDIDMVKTRILEHTALMERGIGELNKAETGFKLVCTRWTSLVGPEDMHTMRAQQNLASVYDMQGRLDAAEQLLHTVLQTTEALLGDTHPNTLQSEHDIASVYEYKGKYAMAEAAYTHCRHNRVKLIGEKSPKTLTTMHNLALVYEAQGRYQTAKALSEEVLKLRTEVLGELHSDTGRAYNSMASLHIALGNYASASHCVTRALEVKQATLKTRGQICYTHPSIILTKNLEAGLNFHKGLFELSLEQCDNVVPTLMQALAVMVDEENRERHPSLLTTYYNKAIVCCAMSAFSEAKRLFRKSYDGRIKTLGEGHILTIRSLNNLAWATVQEGHGDLKVLQEAKLLCERARKASFSLPSSTIGTQYGIECLDRAVLLHNECHINQALVPEEGPGKLKEILGVVIDSLEKQQSPMFETGSTQTLWEKLRGQDMILDDRWERHRDIR